MENRGDELSRRRSTDKHQPLTISVPGSLMTRLDQELSYKQSRSKWVQQAIKAKLDAYEDDYQVISSLSDLRLITILLNRGVIDLPLWELLKSNLQSEETGAGQ